MEYGEGATSAVIESTITGRLSERAMLASLTVRLWSGRKYDKKVTNEVHAAHGVAGRAGRYNKVLLPQDADSLKALGKIAGEARTYHYANTLPWSADGARILPSANYMEYARAMAGYRRQFELAVPVFEAEYPALKAQAQALLNGMYNPEDYPDKVGALFGFEVRMLPLPDAGDFRVQLGDDVTQAIRDDIQAQVEASVKGAVSDLWKRVYEAAARMAERLGDPEAVFRDTLVENVRDLVRVLPKLNLTGDAALVQVEQDLAAQLARWEPDELRENKATRATVATQADAIAKKAAQYAGIFG